MDIKIKRIGNGKLPTYKTSGSVGADCYARIDEQIILKAKSQETGMPFHNSGQYGNPRRI